MKYFILLFVIICFAGCSKSTGVMSIGKDKYMISTDVSTEFYAPSDAVKKSIEEATLYCNSLDKDIFVENIQNTNNDSNISSNCTLIFQCVDKK
mgnify:FL=1